MILGHFMEMDKISACDTYMNTYIQTIPELLVQTLSSDRGHHKDSDLHTNL